MVGPPRVLHYWGNLSLWLGNIIVLERRAADQEGSRKVRPRYTFRKIEPYRSPSRKNDCGSLSDCSPPILPTTYSQCCALQADSIWQD